MHVKVRHVRWAEIIWRYIRYGDEFQRSTLDKKGH